ncbi:hypothetical protein BX661DRAFT_186730, partial [Kickxella alabastrina]|uniref:uncharacterized protein n=1 Tax=Kickxella alabastrina TaxID=61397 RepID=UPI002220F012
MQLDQRLNRVEYGKSVNVTVDPRGKPDMIMLIFFSVIYCFDFFVLAYMLWNKKYPPIKSKNPILMTILMLISMTWFVGDLQSNGHVPLANTPLTNCKAFGFVCALTALRAYGLYRVFYLNLPYHSLGLYLPVLNNFLHPVLRFCSLDNGFKTSLFVLLGITCIDHFGTHLLWWLIMAVPMYNCMFNRQRYLTHWINKLRKDGLQKNSDAIANNGHESLLQATTDRNKDDGLFYARTIT